MPNSAAAIAVLGRYAIHGEIASGGMATVHYGRLLGGGGFSKIVAIKRLHPQFAKDPEFVSMFLDEARLAARVRHPNVVSTLDVVASDGELFVVMEYVQGEPLSRLFAALRDVGERLPPRIATAILTGALHGLHAAHEATDERGEPLHIVHRDVSPQNILVGADGVARVLDFGVAKAAGRAHTTREGQLKGKLGYMSPEQLMGRVSRATDIFAASIVLWEALAGRRLFTADSEGEVVHKIIEACVDPPSKHAPDVPAELDAVTLRGLARDPNARFATARDMARALENVLPPATASDVGDFVERWAGSTLAHRKRRLASIEAGADDAPTSGVRPSSSAEADTLPDGQPQTQLSASSDGALAGVRPAARRPGRTAMAMAVIALGLLIFAGARLVPRRAATTARSASAATLSLPSPPNAEPSSTASPAQMESTSSPPPAAKPVNPPPARGGPSRPALHAPARPAAPNCSPPYVIDGVTGDHIYKRECAR